MISMSNSTPNEFALAGKLIDEGKMEEALGLALKLHGNGWIHIDKYNNDQALEIAFQCKDLFDKIGNQVHIANNFLLIGYAYNRKGNFKDAKIFSKRSFELQTKLDNQEGIASSLTLMSSIQRNMGNLDQSIKFSEQSLSIKEITPRIKANNFRLLGTIYLIRGELSQTLKYCEGGIKLASEGKFIEFCPFFLYLMGMTYYLNGDYDQGEDYLRKNLVQTEKLEIMLPIRGVTLLVLIWLNLVKNLSEEARKYFEILQKLVNQNKTVILTYTLLVAKGLILQKSGRMRDRAEAEDSLKKVIHNYIADNIFVDLAIYPYALYFLCDLLIEELGMSNNLGIIDEINIYLSKLRDSGEKYKSYLYLTEEKIFQARLALIQLEFDETRLLLTQAQHMAEMHELQYFAQIVSSHHDRLLEQQDILEQLQKTNAPISERMKYASFDGVLARVRGNRSEKLLELTNETPVLLLIITKGGSLVFSQVFSENLTVESDLISSFLSAFESFGDELFSERLDRIKYGENTILMKPLENFSVCYLFKGQSYNAQKKLTLFFEKIQNDAPVLQALENAYKTSSVLEIQDVPSLESFINEIFIQKNPELKV